MLSLRQTSIRNGLLRALSIDDYALLAPHLEPIDAQVRQDLIAADQPITECYFPEEGVASVVASHMNKQVEVGMIGREGLVGAMPILLDDDRTPHATFVQVAGRMLAIATSALLAAVEQSAGLRRLLLRYVQTHLLQVTQTAHAQATLGLEGRMARWLLMCHDRIDSDEIHLTHEFLSMMLGVQRAGVTLTLQNLEGGGRIKSQRRRITILDRERLEALAGDAYGVAESEYLRLIGKV